MDSTNTEQFLPSRGLAIASAFAKGWGDYKKRLQEQEMAKQAQRSELLKVILPRYMEQEASRAEWERERPLEHAKFQLEQQKVTQTGQLGFAGLQVEIAGLQNAWNISQSESASATERASAKNLIDVQLKGLDVKIEEYRQQAANLRQSMQSGAAIDVAQIRAETDIDVEAMRSGKALNVARIGAEASKDRVTALIASDERIAGWNNETKMAIAKMPKPSADFPKALSEQADMYQAEANLAAAVWGMALQNPDYVGLANQMIGQVATSKASLDQALTTFGGAPMPDIPIPELGVEPTGILPIWPFKGEKTVPVVPGITPSPGVRPGEATTGLEVQGLPPAMRLPELRTSGPEFEAKLNLMIQQGATKVKLEQRKMLEDMGINPDALEAAAREGRATEAKPLTEKRTTEAKPPNIQTIIDKNLFAELQTTKQKTVARKAFAELDTAVSDSFNNRSTLDDIKDAISIMIGKREAIIPEPLRTTLSRKYGADFINSIEARVERRLGKS